MTMTHAADDQANLSTLSVLSIETLEGLLRNSGDYPILPVKPRLMPNASPAQLRAHAAELEAHENAMAVYREEWRRYHAKQALIQEAWRAKLRQQYAAIPEGVYAVLYDKAYADGHSGGYDEVRNTLANVVSFYEDIVSAQEK